MKIVFLKALTLMMLSLGTSAFSAAPSIPQTMNYWFDECAWNGTTQQVVDHSVNTLYGTAMGGATTNDVTKVIQRATYFDGVDDYVDTGRNLEELHARSASLSFWIKTTQKGNDIPWRAPAIAGAEEAGTTDDMYWGYIDVAGHIGLSVGDDNMVQSTTLINDDEWHHIVLTRSLATNEGKVYVDGVLEDSGILNDRLTVLAFQSIGRSEGSAYYKGYLDEIEIYEGTLTATDVGVIYNNELLGFNYDGTIRAAVDCALPVANVDVYTTGYQTSVSDNVMANDTGTNITAAISTGPSNGTLVMNANGAFTYTPAPLYSGADSFSYTITDQYGNTSTATVTIYVEDAPVVIPTNLVAEYRMDECAFDGTVGDVIDNSKNIYHGTSSGNTSISVTKKDNQICSASVFDGNADVITVAGNTDLAQSGTTSITVSFWINMNGTNASTDDVVLGMYDSDSDRDKGWGFNFSDNNNRLDFFVGTRKNKYYEARTNIPNTGWHHIVGVYAYPNITLYVDNIKFTRDTSDRFLIDATDGDLTIGGSPNFGNDFAGQVDEVKIFNNAFTDANVTDMYNNELAYRNWNDTTDTRVCNTCTEDVTYTAGGNFWHLISLQSDFRSAEMTAKTTSDVLGDNFGIGDYDPSNTNPDGWILIRRDYETSVNNDASYHTMGIDEELEYGKGYWLGSKQTTTWDANLKTMDFDVVDNPACRSANGKCVLVDLEEPNGTDNNGPYIYTMTSFPIAKAIRWTDVRILIDGVAYTPDEAQSLPDTFNATIWEYDPASQSYSDVAPNTPGVEDMIKPYVGYWIELDKNTANKTVQLLVPQE